MKCFMLILSIILYFTIPVLSDELIGVTVVVNHGDTIPSKFYPNDPYQDPAIWRKPLGQLSNLGEQQSYQVGKWLLKRYITNHPLITLHYNASLIYTFSEDRDESLMSGECVMAGLLPPVGDEIWNRKLLWRPTPVHNAPLFLDNYIGRGVYCPRYEEELQQISHGRYLRFFNREDRALLNYLTLHTGKTFKNIGQIPALFNILTVQQNHNFTLPAWTDSVFPNEMAKVVLEDSIIRTKNLEIARLSIGPFFNQVQTQFNAIVNNSNIVGAATGTIRKFRMFISNDTIFYDALHALDVPSVGVIPFSASLMFELWKTDGGSNYVKLLYKKTPDLHAPLERLQIPMCKGIKCPYTIFNKIMNKLAVGPVQWRHMCNQTMITPIIKSTL